MCGAASHRVHVQRVDAEVVRRQVHVLEHLHERLTPAALHVHHLVGIFLHRSLDEPQQMLLIHAGRGVDVSVHLTHGHTQCESTVFYTFVCIRACVAVLCVCCRSLGVELSSARRVPSSRSEERASETLSSNTAADGNRTTSCTNTHTCVTHTHTHG